MKKCRLFFALIVSSFLFGVSAQAETLNKEQIIISTDVPVLKFISDDGKISDAYLESNDLFTAENGSIYISLEAVKSISKQDTNNDLDVIKKDGKTYVPLRGFFNSIGYRDEEIIYNLALKTVFINKNPVFDTDKITVTDKNIYHYRNTPEIITITNKEDIEKFTAVLNEEPFFQSSASYGGSDGTYIIDFNNGTVLNIVTEGFCKIYIDGKCSGNYIMPFKSYIEAERLIRKYTDLNKINYDKWVHTDYSEEELYRRAFIACDFNNDDYSYALRYLDSKIDGFLENAEYDVKVAENGSKTLIIKYNGKEYSVTVYKDYGIRQSALDATVRIFI